MQQQAFQDVRQQKCSITKGPQHGRILYRYIHIIKVAVQLVVHVCIVIGSKSRYDGQASDNKTYRLGGVQLIKPGIGCLQFLRKVHLVLFNNSEARWVEHGIFEMALLDCQ